MSDKIQPLEFEKPIMAMEEKIEELMKLSQETRVDFRSEIETLRRQAEDVRNKLYQRLTPAQKLQVARHPQRPSLLELIKMLSPEVWIELHGDRGGIDD